MHDDKQPHTEALSESAMIELFRDRGAFFTGGHYAISPRYHTSSFVVKQRLTVEPQFTGVLGVNLAAPFLNTGGGFQVVVCPAPGALLLGNAAAEHRMLTSMLVTKIVYAVKDSRGRYHWRGLFEDDVRGKRVLIVEDMIYTGGTAKQLVRLVHQSGGEVVGVSALWNCSNVSAETIGAKLHSAVNVPLERWTKKKCPMCAKGMPTDTRVGYGRRKQ